MMKFAFINFYTQINSVIIFYAAGEVVDWIKA